MDYIHHYKSPIGGITVASDGDAIVGLWFDGQKYFTDTLDKESREVDIPVFADADRWLDIYFSGKNPNFCPKLNLRGTEFRRTVWELLLDIPFGETVTYGDLSKQVAAKLGRPSMSAQATGSAVGHNPISLMIPCHRVVGADGSLTGYAGGTDKKEYLLRLEGINVDGRARVIIPKT